MAEIGSRMPWRVWCRIHLKAIAQAIPMAFLIVVESRDLYYRATWEVTPMGPSQFTTGDVIAICNRWYTLPTWQHVLYSWFSKVLLKSSWDDVGVIVVKADGKPSILYCDFTGAHEEPLDVFLESRVPRGAAVRKLVRDDAAPAPSTQVADLFYTEVQKIKPTPWYAFRASMRGGQAHKYYEFCVGMNAQRQRIQQMRQRDQSAQAIRAQQQRLGEMDVMRKHMLQFVESDGQFHLFNGSLVASFLATFGYLDREHPPPSQYVVQDFAHDMPFTGATRLMEPVVFFKN